MPTYLHMHLWMVLPWLKPHTEGRCQQATQVGVQTASGPAVGRVKSVYPHAQHSVHIHHHQHLIVHCYLQSWSCSNRGIHIAAALCSLSTVDPRRTYHLAGLAQRRVRQRALAGQRLCWASAWASAACSPALSLGQRTERSHPVAQDALSGSCARFVCIKMVRSRREVPLGQCCVWLRSCSPAALLCASAKRRRSG